MQDPWNPTQEFCRYLSTKQDTQTAAEEQYFKEVARSKQTFQEAEEEDRESRPPLQLSSDVSQAALSDSDGWFSLNDSSQIMTVHHVFHRVDIQTSKE